MKLLLISVVLIFLNACVTPSSDLRKPSSANGSAGKSSSGGAAGRSGSAVFETGCESFALQIGAAMNDSFSAQSWADDRGTVSFMCGAKPSISPAALEKIHGLFDLKMKNLLQSGYLKDFVAPSMGAPRTWEGLKMKAQSLSAVFSQLESNRDRDFGCVDGQGRDGDRAIGKVKACFTSRLRYIETDGRIETKLTMRLFRWKNDGSIEGDPIEIKQSTIHMFPALCPNGVPQHQARDVYTTEGTDFTQVTSSTCQKYEAKESNASSSLLVSF